MDEIKLKVEHIAEQCVSSKEQKLRVLGSNAVPQDFECYKKAVKMFLKNCIIHGEVFNTPSRNVLTCLGCFLFIYIFNGYLVNYNVFLLFW